MSVKFYVYGGSRWRELDVNTGRVSGWAKSARIVVARGGRLECPRAGPVLRALRALAAGEPSRARDGPRLPHTREEDQHESQHLTGDSLCRHCCNHRNNAVLDNLCKHVQSAPPVPPPPRQPQPRQRLVATRALQTDHVFDKVRNECVQQREFASNVSQKLQPPKRIVRVSSDSQDLRRIASHRRRKRLYISSNSSVELVAQDIIDDGRHGTENIEHELSDTEEKRPGRRGRPPRPGYSSKILGIVTGVFPGRSLNNVASLNITSSKWNATSTPNNTSVVRHNRDVSHGLQSLVSSTNIAEQSIIISSKSNEDSSQSSSDHTEAKRARCEGGTDDEKSVQTTEARAKFVQSLHIDERGTANKDCGRTRDRGAEVCKELVIDESDVIALRGFLVRCAPSVSLLRFDSDDEYKRRIFYRINPLVNIERSERIRQLLCEADDISLRDFASQLGLRSVSDDVMSSGKISNETKTGRMRKQPDRYTEKATQLPTKSPDKKSLTSTKARENTISKSSVSVKTSNRENMSKTPVLTKTTHRENGVSHRNHKNVMPKSDGTTKTARDKVVSKPHTTTTARDNVVSESTSPTKRLSCEHALKATKTTNTSSSFPGIRVKTMANDNAVSKSIVTKERTARENGVSTSRGSTNQARENGGSLQTKVSKNIDEGAPEPRELQQEPSPSRRAQPHRKLKPTKPARDKVNKEYSRSEDAAIVGWVSGEGRARLVNGNRVWRDLEDQYERLTGQARTWQSLRNRYLRYILPTLSSLAVPPARAARLRADAAAGEIKSKRRPARRNSIFATPGVRGAWSRRPRPPSPSPSCSPPHPPHDGAGGRKKRKRSSSSSSSSSSSAFVRRSKLRYSEVTRQFAGRQAARLPPGSSSSRATTPSTPPPSPPSPPSPTVVTTRTRRLFNPKTML